MNQTIRLLYRRYELLIKSYFPAATILHFTGGVGLVMNEHFQIDTANIAENNKQFSISTVYRF